MVFPNVSFEKKNSSPNMRGTENTRTLHIPVIYPLTKNTMTTRIRVKLGNLFIKLSKTRI